MRSGSFPVIQFQHRPYRQKKMPHRHFVGRTLSFAIVCKPQRLRSSCFPPAPQIGDVGKGRCSEQVHNPTITDILDQIGLSA